MLQKIFEQYRDSFLLAIIAVIIGVITGAIDCLFGKILINISTFRDANFIKLIFLLPFLGLFIIFLYKKYGKNSIKGMSLVFGVAHNEEDSIPLRLVPLVIISTWLTHLFGGSAGREGVAVQIGATIADNLGKLTKIKDSKKILIVTGMAAGFSGLFHTPIAAIFFALEVLVVGSLEYNALLPAVIASFVSNYTSSQLGLEKFHVILKTHLVFNIETIIKISIISILFGIVGGLFAHILNHTKQFLTKKLPNPYMKIAIIGAILSITLVTIHFGRYSGLGTNLINDSFLKSSDHIYVYDWLFKFVLTIVTLAAGFQGGEVTPLFAIGSSLGVILGSLLGLPCTLVAALGYSSVFAGATNTFIAPIFIGVEVFGYENLPYFFLSCSIAYLFSGNKSIYTSQKVLESRKEL
ncbi:chloride channel protein [Anaeromicropila herbilytica]|uniref:Voltage-gated chloride channel protein n=1 Tax=Anaeromicropila herbilytica TaxID=2785025 RepID=A0A7R7IEE2_9FIRM|nr:chloride channel protein [Anaeromicropila herbilytica]BCN32014.1 voltage-gated chloride channel protein [Anaeromicropila herbilytica]